MSPATGCMLFTALTAVVSVACVRLSVLMCHNLHWR